MTDNTEFSLPPGIKFFLIKKIETHKIIALNEARLLAHEEKYLEFHDVSGVIMFERNVENLSQFGDLIGSVTDKLRKNDLPPLVMVDHEGDTVSVLRRLIGIPPSPFAIAVTGDPGLARDVARETGREMRKLGVNVVLSPVADCVLDPSSPITGLRTFGRDPERVAEFVHQAVLGYKEAGIACCAKHFPGHGSTPEDSHETLPVVKKTREELGETDLVPFMAAVRADVDMVMISHVAFPLGEDVEIPASFDRRVVGGLLRDEFGFGGVVMTDALDMAASRKFRESHFGGLAGGVERPLFAGTDLLLYSEPIPSQMQIEEGGGRVMSLKVMEMIIHTLDRIIDRDRIGQKVAEAAAENETLRSLLQTLDTSEERILALRNQLRATSFRDTGEAQKESAKDKVIRLEDYASTPTLYQSVSERSIVLTKDPAGFVPVTGGTECLLMPVVHRSGLSLRPQNLVEFLSVLRRHFPSWERTDLIADFDEGTDGRMQPVPSRVLEMGTSRRNAKGGSSDTESAWAKGEDFFVPEGMRLLPVVSARGVPPDDWLARFESFLEAHLPPLMIVTGWPLANELPESIGCLLTFGASPQAATAAARVLAGELEPIREVPGGLVL